MAVNLKSQTPKSSLPSTGVLFGADSTSADSPSTYALTAISQGVNINSFGAVGDAQTVNAPGQAAQSVSITSGANILTVTGAGFTSADVGKTISVSNAGSYVAAIATNQELITTISAYISSTQVQLAANAAATLSASNGLVTWGTDNTTAIQNAINSSSSAVYVPIGRYLTTLPLTLQSGQTIYGDGYNSNIIQVTPSRSTIVTAQSCVVRNLRLTLADAINASEGVDLPAGVKIRSVNNVIVENNWIEGGDYGIPGVYGAVAKNITIRNNICYGNKWTNNQGGGPGSVAADIMLYGLTSKTLIEGNYCLSNNSQGISAGIGTDLDYVIANNSCFTLDPATCYPGGTWSEITTGNVRRHGIIAAYNGSSNRGPKAVITGNIIRNTTWTGIYRTSNDRTPAANNNGPVVISNNIISDAAVGSPVSLLGGIVVTQCNAGDLIDGNIILDYQGNNGGAITISGVQIDSVGLTTISNNVIKNSASSGINLLNWCVNVLIKNNTFIENTGTDIIVGAGTGVADCNGHKIIGNTIIKATGSQVSAIFIDPQSGTRINEIYNNNIVGGDNTNSNTDANAAIRLNGSAALYAVRNNKISNFFHGIYYTGYQNTTNRTIEISYNEISNCNTGIRCEATVVTVTIPLVNNTFTSVTNPVGANPAYTAGRICQRLGNTLIVDSTASQLALSSGIPTRGDWLAGDKIFVTAPTAGNYVGAVCTTSGTVGTMAWQRFGAVTLSGSSSGVSINAGVALANGASWETADITVTGAALGDYVTGVSFDQTLQGCEISGYVRAANAVRVVFTNNTGTAKTFSTAGTVRANVMKQ